MKKHAYIILILLTALLFVFVSCNAEIDPASAAANGSGGENGQGSGSGSGSGSSGSTVDEFGIAKSTIVMSFNGLSYSSDDGIFTYDFNLDSLGNLNTNFKFECYHYDDKGNIVDGAFVFTCEELTLYNVQDNSCTINALNANQIGTYTVYAKSDIKEAYDRYFMINVTCNNPSIEIEYSIKSAYINSNLQYTDEMKSGTITKYTKELTLVAGAVYDFSVSDASSSEYQIKNLYLTSSNNRIYFREQNGNRGEFVCLMSDGAESVLKFQIGQTNISVSVKATLEDITQAGLDYLDPNKNTVEDVLCFTANTIDNQDQSYTYQVNLESVLQGSEAQELMFSLDFEDWDAVAENNYLDQKNYRAAINSEASWYSKITLFRTWDAQQLFQLSIDGMLRQFTITPLRNTVFNSTNHGTKNLHCYVYAKYKNDPNNTYRWKWRIMIGGTLESVDLYQFSGNQETLANDIIEIREGSETGWILRAKYTPTTSAVSNTLWYVAKDLTTLKTYKWTNPAGGTDIVTKTLPVPAPLTDNSCSVLRMLGSPEPTAEGREINKVDDDSVLRVYNYFWDTVTNGGISENSINYTNNGEDCVLVAVNLETGLYDTILFKNYQEALVTIKGIGEEAVGTKGNTREKNGSSYNKITLYTSYPTSTAEQKYYDGYGSGFLPSETSGANKNAGNYRVFYMDVDQPFHLVVETTFEIENIAMSGNYYATTTFENISNVFIDSERKRADIYLSTIWHSLPNEDRPDLEDTVKKQNTNRYSELYMTINSKYKVLLKIIVFDKNLS